MSMAEYVVVVKMMMMKMTNNKQPESNLLLTACKRYYLAAGATQGNIAYTQNVMRHPMTTQQPTKLK